MTAPPKITIGRRECTRCRVQWKGGIDSPCFECGSAEHTTRDLSCYMRDAYEHAQREEASR